MSIIANPTQPSDAEVVLLEIENSMLAVQGQLHGTVVNSFNKFWHGSVPPADLFAAMGSNAVPTFQKHAAAVQCLLTLGAPITPDSYTPPLACTPHADGTITLD